MKKLTTKGSSLFLATIIAASVLSVGCNRVVEPTAPIEKSQTQMRITAGIENAKAEQTMASGVRDNAFVDGDSVGIYVVAYRKPTEAGKFEINGNYVDNAKWSVATAAWSTSPAIFYPTVSVDMYAYSPYDSKFNPTATPEAYVFTVKADQSDAKKIVANDFMTSQVVNQAPVTTDVDMKFYHRLSKLDVKFTLPTTFKGKAVTGLKSIILKGFKSKAVVDLTTRYTFQADGTAGTNDPAHTYPSPATASGSDTIHITPNAVTAGAQYEAIVVPQTQAIGTDLIEIELNIDGGGVEKFIYKPVAAIEFKSSRATVINLSFQADSKVLLGAIAITGWTTSNDITSPINKMSNMILKCAAGTGAIDKTAVSAKLTIEGDAFDATAAWDEANSRYLLKYDHKDHFGGYLTKIVMSNVDGTEIINASTVPATGLQIKGNPLADDYSLEIGTLTFDSPVVIKAPVVIK